MSYLRKDQCPSLQNVHTDDSKGLDTQPWDDMSFCVLVPVDIVDGAQAVLRPKVRLSLLDSIIVSHPRATFYLDAHVCALQDM
jgi:hypothetical protein